MAITGLQLLGWLLFLGSLALFAKQVSWHDFFQDKKCQHMVFGAAASLFFLWLFRAGIYDGLNVHFLWLTALTLMLGLRMSIVSATLALLGITLVGKESWAMFGINGLIGVLLPLSCSYLIYSVTFHRLPRHLFVYIFVCSFFPGALIITLKMLMLGGYYALDGIHSWNVVVDNYLVLIPLLLFPEAMLNGMTMTLLVIYKPDWVYTFHDKFYLHKK